MSSAVDASRFAVVAVAAFGLFSSSRTRASQPAACGAAAEVPVKGEPKPPTPLTETLSAAAQVGAPTVWLAPATPPPRQIGAPPAHCVVVRIWTGPPLEYGSIAAAFCASSAAEDDPWPM